MTLENGLFPPKRLFVFGISGYVGSALAKHCAEELGTEFIEVSGTVPFTSSASASSSYQQYALTSEGALPHEARMALQRATHVLSVVPTAADFTLQDGQVERKAKQGRMQWAGYLSTTGVYGDKQGQYVFEDDESALAPISARGQARLVQEAKWRRTGAPVHIFRLPSIYGPGRASISTRRAFLIHKPGQVFCRIHRDDLVHLLVLSMRKPNPGRVYNCCDDEPAAPHEVALFSYALRPQLAVPPVRDYDAVKHELSDMERSFYQECKRITNHRAKIELGFAPRFPTFREGLQHDAELEQQVGTSGAPPPSRRAAAARPPAPSPLPLLRRLQLPSNMWRRATGWLWWLARELRWRVLVPSSRSLLMWLSSPSPVVILVDNGSVREEPTLEMQRLAGKLEQRLGWPVRCSSWNHVNEALPSRPVLFARRLAEFATGRMIIVPLFLGPSAICTREMPKLLSRSSQTIAPSLVRTVPRQEDDDGEEEEEECLVTKMLLSTLQNDELLAAAPSAAAPLKILLVDHGSPNEDVNFVRRAVACRLRAKLSATSTTTTQIIDCSMERRPGLKYAFNDPLLETVLSEELLPSSSGEESSARVVVLPLFLFPGNHAGEGGDLAQIIRRARDRRQAASLPALQNVRVARLVFDASNDDLALQLLEQRVRDAW